MDKLFEPITTEEVVAVDMFKDDVAYTVGLLWSAADAALAAGDTPRSKELGIVAREVVRDSRDYTVEDIPARIAELRKIREDNLG